jgi:hypothetical protein
MPARAAAGTIADMESRSHDTPEAVRKLQEIEHAGDVGEDERTPLIALGETWVVVAIAVVVVLAVTLIAFYLAS